MFTIQRFSRTWLPVIGLASYLFSANSYALSCKDGSSIRQDIKLDREITVPTANLTPGAVLWRSQTFTSTFTCTDTDNHPQGEQAYLYWDPLVKMQSIHNSLEVGVTYNSIDIKPVNSFKTEIGQGTSCNRNPEGGCTPPAIPHTITVSYSVYIKATGNPPPESGSINDNAEYAIFQVDGVGGLNTSTTDGNFRAYVSGLSNIRFISCNPQISVKGNNGAIVDFGRISSNRARVGIIEKSVPFTISADLTGPGQDCQGQVLMASFSTTYYTQESKILLPAADSGFGIQLAMKSAPESIIPFNTPTELGISNGSVVENDYLASLIWLSNSPKIGTFKASATVDVTFK